MKDIGEAGTLHCANCGTPLEGEFCHHCGQSIHSVLKPVHGLLEDGADMYLHVDGRILRTLPPLLFKPGFLTLEYFAGRRVRYVAPFRLMFVLCLLAFFAFHLATDLMTERIEARTHAGVVVDEHEFDDADSAVEVRSQLKEQLDDLAESRRVPALPEAARQQIDQAGYRLREQANQRLLALGAAPMPTASLAPPAAVAPVAANTTPAPAASAGADAGASAEADYGSYGTYAPIHIAWLPDFANQRLARLTEHLRANWHNVLHGDKAARNDALERMSSGVFGVLPQAMVVMIPLFALLLKLFYVFRRRLYMEHLIAALHSHAFLFLALLLVTLCGMLSTWLRPHAAWVGYAMGPVQGAVMLWIPIYLLIMQKRVYHQGWPMTVLKYWLVGWCYLWLLGIVLTGALMLGMAH
ncbi:DUF3667 domain-containing protein [Frateuria defendens]|uniref:DUF3667 domain-containing protein n=1 Tax=Frateuria defendens TaxID=2219559 RepID=UPI00066FD411|nr:DUF3667 domain-containing protein [Frateuria defendens]